MQEETSLQVSPFLSLSQLSKAFESSWDFCPKVPARNFQKKSCILHFGGFLTTLRLQAFEFDMRRVLMTNKYIMNMLFISKLKSQD